MSGRLDDGELEALYLGDVRDRPWLLVNMISTIDGATAIDGQSSSIGDRQDTVVFRALRAISDVILVAAATARAEHYKEARLPPHLVEWRTSLGREPQPQIAIVSSSLDFDIDAFGDRPPLVLTTERAPSDRIASVDRGDNVFVSGADRVELPTAIDALHGLGYLTVLSEGGPSLNGQLVADDLIDEVCVTIAPLVAGGDSSRIVRGPLAAAHGAFTLDRAVTGEGSLFTRWLRSR